MLKIVLIANAVLLTVAAFIGLLAGYVVLGFSGKVMSPLWALGALAAVGVWLSLRAMGAPTPAALARVGMVSAPFYLLYAWSAATQWTGGRREEAAARAFVSGNAAESGAALAALMNLPLGQGARPVATIVGPALDALPRARQLSAIALFGKLVRHDPPTEQRLAALVRSQAPPAGDAAVRVAAFAALREMRPYELGVRHARFVGLQDDGALTFSLGAPHWIHGDTFTVVEAIMTLPRRSSADPCERAAVPKAEALIVGALGPERVADVVEVDVAGGGRLTGAVRTDAGFVKDTLRGSLPMYVAPGDTVNWCTDPPSVHRSR